MKETIVYETFGGADTSTSPALLAKLAANGQPLFTPTINDLWGDGTFLQNKPGMTVVSASRTVQFGAFQGPILDLLRIRLDVNFAGMPDPTRLPSPDTLAGIVAPLNTVGPALLYVWPVSTLAQRSLFYTTASMRGDMVKVVAASNMWAFLTNPSVSVSSTVTGKFLMWFYNNVNVGTDWNMQSYTVPTGRFGLHHRGYHVILGNALSTLEAGVRISNFQDPTTYPPVDQFNETSEGAEESVGGYTDGEVAYFGSSSKMYRMTGASPDRFRVAEISRKFGIAGMRAGTKIADGEVLAVLTTPNVYTNVAGTVSFSAPLPIGIGVVTPEGVQEIGQRVSSLVRVSADVSQESHVRHWPSMDGALVMMKRAGTSTAGTPVLFWSQKAAGLDSGRAGFFPWTVVGPNCFEEFAGTMYAGVMTAGNANGVIAFFDDTVAGTTQGYIEIPVYMNKKGNIVGITVWADQQGGTASWTAARRSNKTGNLETASTLLGDPDAQGKRGYPFTTYTKASYTTFTGVQDNTNKVSADYVQWVRLTWPSDVIKGKVYRVAVDWEPIGGQ